MSNGFSIAVLLRPRSDRLKLHKYYSFSVLNFKTRPSSYCIIDKFTSIFVSFISRNRKFTVDGGLNKQNLRHLDQYFPKNEIPNFGLLMTPWSNQK
ncbi:hypothetical protein BpHYR1_037999 [Brachionus plicatilis]|uniref:Uncharacterized protein n=1 Tax=Brachionus plicatilis TaxID=10195 RepID=A0A3M7R059_BRAPC|nr:hypothetical protein BpHYR1_037999 [Brachionus plicatilis]